MGFFNNLFSHKQAADHAAPAPAEPDPMTQPHLIAPVSGTLADISTVADQAFASKAMGDGIAIVPTDGTLVAPTSGKIEALFPTGHALGITGTNGITVMVHVGIDTVEMQGDGFTLHAAQGDTVTEGQVLLEFDIDKIRAAGYDPVTMMLVVEHSCPGDLVKHADGPVARGDTAMWFA
ncbi:PTS glucose transporter subunit IIA [Collinsella sp. An7]|uniref:PTS sugar transporter subunit IIA n=1 Tax=Collinsella sp. An7 TaxID=1965651 RepID=UPI000B3AAB59|nr:PTS glucose transporter subunit IIA [Collinsella sp. An7]